MIRVKEKEKVSLKLIQKKKKRSWHPVPSTSWQIDGEKVETLTNFVFLGSKITRHNCSHKIKTYLLRGRKAMMNLAY